MNREEMLTRAHEIAAMLEQDINTALELGILEPEEAEDYTWCDLLYENTSVDVDSAEELEQLSDDDLARIVNSF